jgi:hypothetical protein
MNNLEPNPSFAPQEGSATLHAASGTLGHLGEFVFQGRAALDKQRL